MPTQKQNRRTEVNGGKADGTASNFTLISTRDQTLFVGYIADVTIYGGTFVAGSESSIKRISGNAVALLGEGLVFAKKDDTTSIVNGNVDTITESVTVVTHTPNFVDNECACGAINAVASIGDTTYTDLKAAFDDAIKSENDGCTVIRRMSV